MGRGYKPQDEIEKPTPKSEKVNYYGKMKSLNKYRTILQNRHNVRNSIRIMNRNRNCFKWSSHETDSHINMKFAICKWLKKNKIEFYTEAIFDERSKFFKFKGFNCPKGLRADIINADEKIIYEVFQTESHESLEQKSRNYPFEVRFVYADQRFREELLL